MRTAHRSRRSITSRSAFVGFCFPSDVIVLAVRWCLRFGLSYRDVEELLTERGVEVDHLTVDRWGCASRRSWPTPPTHAATLSGTDGRWTRRMGRSPAAGARSTGRSTSSAR